MIKEGFCSACITTPLGLVGNMGVGKTINSKTSQGRNVLLIIGIIILLLSIILFWYFTKNCNECR